MMLSRAQRREKERVTRQLHKLIASEGVGRVLDRIFGPGSWTYDAQEQLWIVPDTKYTGVGRSYYCVRANGDWFKAELPSEHAQ